MITKRTWSICCLAVLLLFSPFLVQAEQAPQLDKGKDCRYQQLIKAGKARRALGSEALWWRSGNKEFKKHCKSCHYRGNDVGATFLHVESKTQRGWDLVFTKRYPQCANDGSWDSLTKKQLQDINDFLCRYAYGTAGVYEAFFG